jgi:hypothetical protein
MGTFIKRISIPSYNKISIFLTIQLIFSIFAPILIGITEATPIQAQEIPTCYTVITSPDLKLYNLQDRINHSELNDNAAVIDVNLENVPDPNPCTNPNSYPEGTIIKLKANNNNSYTFYQWTGNLPWRLIENNAEIVYPATSSNDFKHTSSAFLPEISFTLTDNIDNNFNDIPEVITIVPIYFENSSNLPIVKRYPVDGRHNMSIDIDRGLNTAVFQECGTQTQDYSNSACHNKENAQDIFGEIGTPIYSAQSGTLRFDNKYDSGADVGGGNSIYIVDSNGWEHYYTHFDVVCMEGTPTDLTDGRPLLDPKYGGEPSTITQVYGRNGDLGGEGGLTSYFTDGVIDNDGENDYCNNYIKAGDHVSTGTLLGFLGKDGTAVDSTAHLHYGIFQETAERDSQLECTQINPFGLLYQFETNSCNGRGGSGGGGGIEYPPPSGIPSALSPNNQSFEIINNIINLSWSSVENADAYRVVVEIVVDGTSQEWGTYFSTGTSLSLDLLDPTKPTNLFTAQTQFRWKVTPSNHSVPGNSSDYANFTYNVAPAVASNLVNIINADKSVKITWDNLQVIPSIPVYYTIEMQNENAQGVFVLYTNYSNINGGSIPAFSCTQLTCEMTFFPSTSFKKYQWKVTGTQLGISGTPSNWSQFTMPDGSETGCTIPGPIGTTLLSTLQDDFSTLNGTPTPSTLGDCLNVGNFGALYYNKGDLKNITDINFNSAQPVYYDVITSGLHFDWTQPRSLPELGSPHPGYVDYNDFGAVYRGKFHFEAGEYVFSTKADDGIRVYINDVMSHPIIDQWGGNTDLEDSAIVKFSEAGDYTITVQYYEKRADASLHLNWATSCNPIVNQFCVNYFNNKTWDGMPAAVSIEEPTNLTTGSGIEHNWSKTSMPPTGVDLSPFTAKWEGEFQFEENEYIFVAETPDNVKLFVDGILLLDSSTSRDTKLVSELVSMSEGEHTIKVEYLNTSGDAKVKFFWDSAPKITNKDTASGFSATNGRYVHYVTAEDSEADNLTYSLVNPLSGMTINSSTGKIVWTNASTGNQTITVEVTDGELKDTEIISVNVLSANGIDTFDNEVIVGETREISFGLYNSGGAGAANLNISSVTIVGGETEYFTVTTNNCNGASLPPSTGNIQCRVYMNFSPDQLGTRTMLFKIVSNGANSPFYIAMIGEGVESPTVNSLLRGLNIPVIDPAIGLEVISNTKPKK